jgi:hypothetical protein
MFFWTGFAILVSKSPSTTFCFLPTAKVIMSDTARIAKIAMDRKLTKRFMSVTPSNGFSFKIPPDESFYSGTF